MKSSGVNIWTLIAHLSIASPCQSPAADDGWAVWSKPASGWPTWGTLRGLPALWMYTGFCRFLPIIISQEHLSLSGMLLNSYLGSHHLMSQLLWHPFPGHWQTQSCPDGVLIHDAAADIIPSSHTLLSFCSSSSFFSLLYQTSKRSSLSRTLPPYCSFYSDQKVNSHTQIGHSPCRHWSLANFSMRCLCSVSEPHLRICEKVSVKLQYHFVAAPQCSLQKYLLIK